MRGAFWRTTADLLRGRPIIQGDRLEEVWALKDVKLQDPPRRNRGRTAGIIGRNGAGKSTVLHRRNTWLKVLSTSLSRAPGG